MRLPFLALIVCACSAGTIDQTQVYTSGPTEFHWELTQDYGYLAIDTAGQIVSGLTDGFTPWLIEDGTPAGKPIVEPPCDPGPIAPPSPGPPHTTATPEPATFLLVGIVLVLFGAGEPGK